MILTTDADGRVDPDWIASNLDALRKGADTVAGWAELDPIDWGAIPLSLHEDDARECAYDALCNKIRALLDPDPADPLPRHTQNSGASLAITVAAYRMAGGVPLVPSGEDRALVAALRRIDARIRHAPQCRVIVSGRTVGRASGGMADTINRRLSAQDPYLDDRLETAVGCAKRAAFRYYARKVYIERGEQAMLSTALNVDSEALAKAMKTQWFGAAWEIITSISPLLKAIRVATKDVNLERDRAKLTLKHALTNAAQCRSRLVSTEETAFWYSEPVT